MRDLLTKKECDQMWANCFHDEAGVDAMLQAAARLGAEREREATKPALRSALSHLRAWQQQYGEANPAWLPPYGMVDVMESLEEAIRRGEGETDAAAIGMAS